MKTLSFEDIQTPSEVWTKLLELNPIDPDEVFYEPFRGTGNLFNQVTNKKYWTEITEGKDVFDFNNKNEITCIYTNPPYICSIPDKKGNFKEKNAVYFFMEYFITNYPNLKKIGFIMNMKCFNSFTPIRLSKLQKLGFTISSITMFNCNFWFGLNLFVVFDKDDNNCFKFIEKPFTKK